MKDFCNSIVLHYICFKLNKMKLIILLLLVFTNYFAQEEFPFYKIDTLNQRWYRSKVEGKPMTTENNQKIILQGYKDLFAEHKVYKITMIDCEDYLRLDMGYNQYLITYTLQDLREVTVELFFMERGRSPSICTDKNIVSKLENLPKNKPIEIVFEMVNYLNPTNFTLDEKKVSFTAKLLNVRSLK